MVSGALFVEKDAQTEIVDKYGIVFRITDLLMLSKRLSP